MVKISQSSAGMDNFFVESLGRGFPRGSSSGGGRSHARRFICKTSSFFEFCILLVFVSSYPSTISAIANFSVQDTSSATSYKCGTNMICLGQAHEYTRNTTNGMQVEVLSLIWEPPHPGNNLGVGVAYYIEPVRLVDTSTKQLASFYTSFSIAHVRVIPPHHGDGMAFVISGDKETLGAERGFLGIFNSDGITIQKTIVVEFDFHQNVNYPMYDISDNHVSLDFKTITATVAANASDVDVFLYSNLTTFAWVEYSNWTQQLEVRISNNNSRPISPLLSCRVNLSEVVDEYMWVGFSAGSGDFYANYYVGSWTFESYGIPPSGPAASVTQNAKTELGRKSLVGIAALLLCGSFIVLIVRSWVAKLIATQVLYLLGWRLIEHEDPTLKSVQNSVHYPKEYTYRELYEATGHFSKESELGVGGSGAVYLGMLPSSDLKVAVKKLHSSPRSEKEFLAEVSNINLVRHDNLIQLFGWCINVPRSFGSSIREYLLVYELMEKGSLHDWLYNREANGERKYLSWPQRFNIVNDIARALQYLQHGFKKIVVHRDIKPSNIMLDDQFNAKLADFGLSRLVDRQAAIPSSEILGEHLAYIAPEAINSTRKTTVFAGTFGYIAPEAFISCTDKTDVYAFGVVVLEIVCGRKPYLRRQQYLPHEEEILVDWVWKSSGGELLTVVERQLLTEVQDYDRRQMEVMLKIGLLCTHDDPDCRPSMGTVVQVLAGDMKVPDIPPRQRPSIPYLPDPEADSYSTSQFETIDLAPKTLEG